MSYQVSLRPGAERQRRKLGAQIRQRVNEALLALEDTPRPPGVAKLRGADREWRIRIGDYRIIYEISDEETQVIVLRITHRREAYR